MTIDHYVILALVIAPLGGYLAGRMFARGIARTLNEERKEDQ